MFLPHFDVLCDLLQDRSTAEWNLFVLCNKELNFVRIKAALFHVRRAKVGPSPFWQTRKKPFDAIYDLYEMKQSRHCQTWLERRFSWNENLQGSKNWTAKSTILKENGGKVESVFVIRSTQWAEKLGCCLDYCRGWKLRSENLRLRSTWRPFDSSFERKGALVGGNLCPPWSVILKSIWNSVKDTF